MDDTFDSGTLAGNIRGYSLDQLVRKTSRLLDSGMQTTSSRMELKIFPIAEDVFGFCIERNLGRVKSRGRLYVAANYLLPTIENTVLTTAVLSAGRISLDEKRSVDIKFLEGKWSLRTSLMMGRFSRQNREPLSSPITSTMLKYW